MLDASYILPAGRTPPKYCMIALHGYGQSRDYMVKKLAKPLAIHFPEMMFVIPNAPDTCRQAPEYYDWLRYDGEWVIENITSKMQETMQRISAFTDVVLADHAIDDSHLIFSGFSQGAAIALYTATQRITSCAGVLGYSGAITRKALWQKGISRPSTCLIYDANDPVLLQEHYDNTITMLQSDHIPLITHNIPNMGHRITKKGVLCGKDFVEECLKTSS